MPALRFKTCRLLSGNVRNRELTIIQRRILRRLRNKKRSIKRKIYPRENLNSYIQSQIRILESAAKGSMNILRPRMRHFLSSGLIIFLVSLLFSFCLKIGWIDFYFFHALVDKVGFSLGSRAISFALRGVGSSGGIALAILFFASLTAEDAPGHQMAHSGDGDREVTSSSSGNWRQYLNLSSDKEGDSSPDPSTARAPNQGQQQEAVVQPTASPSSSTGVGPTLALEQVRARLASFLASFSRIKPKPSFLRSTEEELGIAHASQEKLTKIAQTIDRLTDGPNRPNSGQNAKALLTMEVEEWSKANEGGH